MKKIIVIVFVLTLLCEQKTAFAQRVLIISDTVSSAGVCQYASLFRDTTGRMPFENVQKQTFKQVNKPLFQYAFSEDTFWFRFQIRNQSILNENNWYFLWSDALKDYVDVYVPASDGTYRVQKGGLLTPRSQKAYSGLFPLYKAGFLPLRKTLTFYIRIKADEAIMGTLTLMTQQAYIDQMPKTLAMVWLVIGIQLLRVLYNIVLAWYIRNVSFRWYAFHTVVVTLSVLGSFGIIGTLLSDFPKIAGVLNAAFFQLMPATYSLFIFSLLNVRQNYPRLRWLFIIVISASILQVLAYPFAPRIFLLQGNTYLFLVTELLLTGISIHALIKRLPFNAYLLIPCFITLIPFAFLNLQTLGFINYDWIYPMIYITNFLEILALSLVIGKVIEVTEKERRQSQNALLTKKLEAQKLVELDRLKTSFFTNISHEFRTPLTLLVSPLEQIRQKYPQENVIPIMQRNVKRLQALISQLLDLTKLEAGQFKIEEQPGDLPRFLSYIFSSFESLAQSQNIKLSASQSHDRFETYFDADKIEKIVTNLISNAFKFTPSQGHIRLKATYQNEGATDVMILEIHDSGIGIEPSRLHKIFDRFYQVDDSTQRNFEGTGIGLALVKELVFILKGKITVQSEVNKGTTFQVELPLRTSEQVVSIPSENIQKISDQAKDHDQTEASASNDTQELESKPIMLIVEDNADLRSYLRSIFETFYKVELAVDGENGVEIAFEITPDIIVSDLMMPRLDGFGLCQQLKSDQRTSHIPVLLLTAKATLSDKLQGLGLGADDYLQKPFNKEELLVRVKNLVQQRAILRQKFSIAAHLPQTESATLPQNLDSLFITKAKKIVESHLADSNFNADTFSDRMAMSRSNLHRKLKALTGQTTTGFVRSIRLRHASELLKQKDLTVSEVACQVGFESLSYFSKTYQEEFGILPSAVINPN